MAKNNKTTFLIFLISTLLLLSIIAGCGSFKKGTGEPDIDTDALATGTEGLVLRFLPDQPPPKVYTQAPLNFLVEVWNRGTHTINNADFFLTGYDKMMIPSLRDRAQISEALEGKSQYNPQGGFTTLMFDSSDVSLPTSMPSYRPTFLLTACYPYQTIATPLICVDPNPQDTVSDKACRIQKSYGTGSQGAPVAVTNIESESNPSYMYFRIHVSNIAGGTDQASGTVYGMDALHKCPDQLTYSDLNTIDFQADLGGTPMDCEPKTGKIRLVNNKAIIFCKYRYTQTGGAYQTPLNVKLFYGYKSSTSTMVEIENLNYAR